MAHLAITRSTFVGAFILALMCALIVISVWVFAAMAFGVPMPSLRNTIGIIGLFVLIYETVIGLWWLIKETE